MSDQKKLIYLDIFHKKKFIHNYTISHCDIMVADVNMAKSRHRNLKVI